MPGIDRTCLIAVSKMTGELNGVLPPIPGALYRGQLPVQPFGQLHQPINHTE